MIRELYSIDNGFFDPLLGSIELPAPTGHMFGEGESDVEEVNEPKVLVLSSGGSGVPVYRKLQKEDTPFIAGILAENDIDYQLARLLAAEVITTPAFEPISEETFARAIQAVESCDRIIATEFPIGASNDRIRQIIEAAETSGKLERI